MSPWIYAHSSFHFASLYYHGTNAFLPLVGTYPQVLPFLTLRVGANFAGASKPRDMICSITHKPPYVFVKTATIPTYYGISIAIPRYIAMQLSTVPFIMTRPIIVILLFAWSCSWHRICGKAAFIILSYMSPLIHCIFRYTAGGIHIESYFVLSIEL